MALGTSPAILRLNAHVLALLLGDIFVLANINVGLTEDLQSDCSQLSIVTRNALRFQDAIACLAQDGFDFKLRALIKAVSDTGSLSRIQANLE